MSTRHSESSGPPRWEDIHPLDKVSCNNELIQRIPAARLPNTVFFVTLFWSAEKNALLYHCEIENQRMTFLQGRWDDLGLDAPWEERECQELHGIPLVRGHVTADERSGRGAVFVITDDGVLYSMGFDHRSRLGRPTNDVGAKIFGRVITEERILLLACGSDHCITMSKTEVFAFGRSSLGQTGVPGALEVSEPTEIYAGTGVEAPCQVASGLVHSAILTKEGKVFTFGSGSNGRTGHGGTRNVDKPTLVKGLKVKVEQIGCTNNATLFLAEGKMLGCGNNDSCSLGLGNGESVYEPTVIDTGDHVIKSFRCSRTIVIAFTLSREVFVWGECDGKIIKLPQILEGLDFPREIFNKGPHRDTRGIVYLDHRHRKLDAMRGLLSKMNAVKSEITEITSNMRALKTEIAACEENPDTKGKSPNKHEELAERLVKHSRQVEDISTVQIKLISVETEHAESAMKSQQVQQAYDDIVADHNALRLEHEVLEKDHTALRNTYNDNKKRQNELKAEQMAEISTLKIKLISEETKRAKLRMKSVQQQKAHGELLEEHNVLQFDNELLKKEDAKFRQTYDTEKKKQNKVEADQMAEMSTLQTKLISEETERATLSSEIGQRHEAYEALLAEHNALLSQYQVLRKDHALLRNTSDEEKKVRDGLKAERMDQISTLHIKLISDEAERAKLGKKHDDLQGKFEDLERTKTDLQEKLDQHMQALSDVISLPNLYIVVNMVGKTWYRLGLKLGVPDFQLDHIDHACPNLPDKALVTLNKWYELAPWQATRDYLADSLVYVERRDIADKIRDKQ